MKDSAPVNLDSTDLRILELLQDEGRISNARLAERLNLSETPAWRRLRRLEEEGFVRGYRAQLDQRKLGYGVTAFVQITLAMHTGQQPYKFEEAIQDIPEILSCHNITGEADYLLQIVARNLEDYGEFVARVLRQLPGVTSIRSSLAMREVKASGKLPVGRT